MTIVTGPVLDRQGDVMASAKLIWRPASGTFEGDSGNAYAPDGIEITTDGSGQFSEEFAPGNYLVTAFVATPAGTPLRERVVEFRAGVPSAGTHALGDIIGQVVPGETFAIVILPKTASYTLQRTDKGKLIEADSASAIVITIPSDATAGWVNSAFISVSKVGTGNVNVTAASGVTLNGVSAGTAQILDQYGACHVYRRAANSWVIIGGIGDVT